MSEINHLQRRVEAVLFASGEPVECKKLAEALEVEPETINGIVLKLKDKYLEQNSAINILILESSFQMATYPEHADTIRKALELSNGAALSNAAMEVLAVIAYNQPVTRSFVEEVRGVDCSYMMRNLVEKDLLMEAGRMNIPGKPILYATTNTFLRSFNLESIEKLPILPEDAPEEPEEQVEGQIVFDDNENS